MMMMLIVYPPNFGNYLKYMFFIIILNPIFPKIPIRARDLGEGVRARAHCAKKTRKKKTRAQKNMARVITLIARADDDDADCLSPQFWELP